MKLIRYAAAVLLIISAAIVFFLPQSFNQLKNTSQPENIRSSPNVFPYPQKTENSDPPPEISALSAVVTDAKSGLDIFEKNAETRFLPASTTKLMTALVALEKCSLDDVVEISYVQSEPNQMGLEPQDKVSVKALLNGLLIVSGNDAAYALSYGCSESTGEFIEEMNKKAIELGMKNTHFTNPAGFDNPAHFSTSKDLAQLGKVAVSNPTIAQIVATKSTVVSDATGNKTYFLQNTNELLKEVNGVEGIKTGTTEGSKEVLLSKTTREGNTIITVVLGSEDRFSESESLIEWAFKNHRWVFP